MASIAALLGAGAAAAGGSGALTAAGLTLGALSAATTIASGVTANQAASKEAKFLNRLGDVEADDRRRATRRLLASQQVAFAGAGVDPTVGTPLDVLGDTVAESELAALRGRFTRRTEARSTKLRGQQALAQGIASGTGTILGTLGAFSR